MKETIRITKIFRFEAAHALDGYCGKCHDIHGHSYELKVTVSGLPEADPTQPHCGMVVDFGDLKKMVSENIIALFDHRLLLRNDSRFRGIESKNERVRYVSYQPTCENMLLEIVGILKNEYKENPRLVKVLLRETETSYAEWLIEDLN